MVKAKLDTKALGELLKNLRTWSEMTQVELAKKVGTPQQNVARFEAGNREMMLSTLNKYARAMGWELVVTARRRSGVKAAAGRRRKAGGDGEPR